MKIGYRGWKIDDVAGLPTLCSPHNRFYWQPGENLAVPDEVHLTKSDSCGFYALKTPESVFEYFYGGRPSNSPILMDIIGEVLLYGDVVEGDRGYRGQKAQVGTLLLPTIERYSLEFIETLCARYDVQYSVASGHTRQVLERYRNFKARQRLGMLLGGKRRRCTAGGRAIVQIRKDEFLL